MVQPCSRHGRRWDEAASAAASGNQGTDRASRPRSLVPGVADHAGGVDRAVDRYPGAGPGRLPAVEADAAVSGPTPGAGVTDSGPDLLQIRGDVTDRLPQAEHGDRSGCNRISTETGAGQWGSALAFACQMFGLESLVYMVKASYQQKPYRRVMMETFGATVHPSPSDTTQLGKRILGDTPDSTGSLGIAISEAVEVAATNADTNYCLGSVLGHVLLHQTVIGLETQKQMEMAGESPDFIIGCVGGGSNYAGFSYPFMADKLAGQLDATFVATEP